MESYALLKEAKNTLSINPNIDDNVDFNILINIPINDRIEKLVTNQDYSYFKQYINDMLNFIHSSYAINKLKIPEDQIKLVNCL